MRTEEARKGCEDGGGKERVRGRRRQGKGVRTEEARKGCEDGGGKERV